VANGNYSYTTTITEFPNITWTSAAALHLVME
jgi:hypothetical protein